ncbi:MAG: DUF4249 family protein [Bacteroidales bacterium]|nr:DUF4249 family protein [Bacteroidales bacterium]
MKIQVFFIGIIALFLASCSTDVELYDDYKDIPVVYGLIDSQADTNFIKITKAFCSDNEHPINANEVAAIFDSSNYPGKLDAFFLELKSTHDQPFKPTGRQFFLDTLTIHDKETGLFYAPHQKLYYTTERFNTNSGNDKYRYRLYVVKPDYDTVTSETGVVGGNIAIGTPGVNFQSTPSEQLSRLVFSSTDEGVLYEIGMQFNYWEEHSGQPMTKKEVSWSYGARTLGAYEKVEGTENLFRLYYSVNDLFKVMERAIGNDTVWDENHPNVVRYMDDFYVSITAAGEDFNNYYQYLQTIQNGLSLSSEYSNVKGGYGLLSSRIIVTSKANLSSGTQFDLFRKPWGFQEN